MPLKFLALSVATLLASGCGGPAKSYATQDLTGNWQFFQTDAFNMPNLITGLTGALSGQGAAVTGVFRAGGCISSTQDIHFTGSEDSSGILTLTSTDLPNNVATLTATISTLSSGFTGASAKLAATGSGPCTMSSSYIQGTEYQPLTGAYTATVNSTTGATATLTASLTQAAANADGQFPESGTLTLATSKCTEAFTLAGVATGPFLKATLKSSSGETAIAGVSLSTVTPQASLPISITVSSSTCTSGAFSGMLNSGP